MTGNRAAPRPGNRAAPRSGNRATPRTGSRSSRPPGQSGRERSEAQGFKRYAIDAAQILLGLTLSCSFAMLGFGIIVGVIVGVYEMTK